MHLNYSLFSQEDKSLIEITFSFFSISYKREINELSTRIKLMLNGAAYNHFSNLVLFIRKREYKREESAEDT